MYRIEQEGYEYLGIRLGQKCLYFGTETTVIGFDENEDDENCAFLMIENKNRTMETKNSSYLTTLLDGYEESGYNWIYLGEVTMIKSEEDEFLSKSISQIHALDVLEDEINQINFRYGIPEPHLTRMQECIKLIRQNWEIK